MSNNTIYKQLADIQSSISRVKKDSKGYGYNYASINAIIKVLGPKLAEHSLCVSSSVEWLANSYHLTTQVINDKGDHIESSTPLDGWQHSLGAKNNPMQTMGAAITYARRYNLVNIFNLYASDDDAECLTLKSNGDYVMPLGSEAGKKLKNVSKDFLVNAKNNLVIMLKEVSKSGKEDPKLKEMLTMINLYLEEKK